METSIDLKEADASRNIKLNQLADAKFLLKQMKMKRAILNAWKQQIDGKEVSLQTFEVYYWFFN